MTLNDPAVDLEEIKFNVAARLHGRFPLVDPDEIDALVAEEAAADERLGPAGPERTFFGRCRWCGRTN